MDKIQIFKPFGPSIVKARMPIQLINQMNNYVDNVIENELKAKDLDNGSNLVGKVKQEFLLEDDFMKKIKWPEFLGSIVSLWIQNVRGIKLRSFQIKKSWIVRQFKNEFNPIHYHSGHISGVGYLKVPKSFGSVSDNKSTNEKGHLALIHGSVNLFSESTYNIKPEIGDFYFFPNYLMHTVYPFTDTDEERRSVSFNAIIDSEAASITNKL
jgi:hypothetical protein